MGVKARVLLNGDCLALLRDMESETIDAVVTDPPYNSGGRTSSQRIRQSSRDKYISGDAKHDLQAFVGDNRDQRAFTLWLTLVLAETLRIARPGAHLLIFTDWRQLPSTSDALQCAGWMWQGIVPWNKPVARPRAGGFRASCEYVLWGSKDKYLATPNIYLPGFFTTAQVANNKRRHITEKPTALLKDLIQIVPAGATVLDPFAGSGAVGEACAETGRKFIGIELSDHYYQVARDRLDVMP